jgi:polyisoprenoid-binding protein YceI
MRVSRLLLLLGCGLPTAVVAALQMQGTPTVAFNATGPAGLRIEGTTHDLTLSKTPEAWVATVSLATVKTGIALRDEHMRDRYLETTKYPTAELRILPKDFVLPKGGEQVKTQAPGVLTVHGKSHPVTVSYTAVLKQDVYAVEAHFDLDMRDYDIQTPRYFGVTVKPPVTVSAVFSLQNR